MDPGTATFRLVGSLGAIWGVLGVLALLGGAVYRLTPMVLEAVYRGLSGPQWVLTVGYCGFMLYSEGYRGFQRRFSPRTAARIRYLRDRPTIPRALLAPAFAMGFFHARRHTKITAWIVTTGIALLVALVRRVEQPWRGIIDSGVVLGLTWGVLSFLWLTFLALTRADFDASPETPDD